MIGQCVAIIRSCGESPTKALWMVDENAKFERRGTIVDDRFPDNESKSKWIKVCNEGYKFDNGDNFVEVQCSSKHEWTLVDETPIPRYHFSKHCQIYYLQSYIYV